MTNLQDTSEAIAAILLNYYSCKDVVRLAESLDTCGYVIPIIIDNSSNNFLCRWCKNNNIKYEDTGENLGYSGGNNIGLRIAIEEGFDYGFILNPDIELQSLDIEGMVEKFEKFEADILFPRVYEPDGEIQYDFPTIENWVLRNVGVLPPLPSTDDDNLRYVDHGPGSAMIIRLDIIAEIGYFREEFFMYGEEVEFCYRARRAGYKVGIFQDSLVLHARPEEEILFSDFKLYYETRNKFIRNKLLFNYSVTYSILIIGYIMKYCIEIIRSGSWKSFHPLTYAVIDGLRLKKGRGRY